MSIKKGILFYKGDYCNCQLFKLSNSVSLKLPFVVAPKQNTKIRTKGMQKQSLKSQIKTQYQGYNKMQTKNLIDDGLISTKFYAESIGKQNQLFYQSTKLKKNIGSYDLKMPDVRRFKELNSPFCKKNTSNIKISFTNSSSTEIQTQYKKNSSIIGPSINQLPVRQKLIYFRQPTFEQLTPKSISSANVRELKKVASKEINSKLDSSRSKVSLKKSGSLKKIDILNARLIESQVNSQECHDSQVDFDYNPQWDNPQVERKFTCQAKKIEWNFQDEQN